MNRLKELRKQKKMLQKDVAKVFNVSLNTYNSWEIGSHEPNKENIKKLADFYNVSVDYIMGRSEDTAYVEVSKLEKVLKDRGLKDKINNLTDNQMELLVKTIEQFKDNENK